MQAEIQTLLILLALLQVKHVLADFFLQTPRMLGGRGTYLHLGRMEHAGLHALLSLLSLLIIGAPLAFVFLLCVAEMLLHYHIDWAKGRYSHKANDTPTDAKYWWAFGIDQLAHQLTYIAMIWCWVAYALS
jgi:hypothetical protein